jgi:hypothetical protein
MSKAGLSKQRELFYAVLVDLGKAVADELSLRHTALTCHQCSNAHFPIQNLP